MLQKKSNECFSLISIYEYCLVDQAQQFNGSLLISIHDKCLVEQEEQLYGGPQSTVYSIIASHPAAPGSNSSIPKMFLEEILKMLRVIYGIA